MKLIIFPHAGGFASYYRALTKLLAEKNEVFVFEYAGRGTRMGENAYESFEDIVFDAQKYVMNEVLSGGEAYCMLGHSMGAYVANEVAFRMQYFYEYPPKKLFISGQSSPIKTKNDYVNVEDKLLIEYIQSLGGTTLNGECFEEYMGAMLPYIRLDMKLLDSYKYNEKYIRLDSDLYLIYGKEDIEIEIEELQEWEKLVSGKVNRKIFAGGHFYLMENLQDFCHYMEKEL